jgi:hypothetical protein
MFMYAIVRVHFAASALAERARVAEMSDGPAEDDPLAAAFAELDASWDDAAAHKKILALADALDRLAEVGKRYRAIEAASPERAEVAKKQIDALLGLAMSRVKATEKTELKPTKSRIEWIAFGVSAALVAAALYSMIRGL